MYSGRAPLCAGCRAVAPPRERRRPAGRRPGACSCRRPARSTRAGVAGAAAGLTTGRATAPQTDHPGTIPARAKRPAATPMEPRPARAPPPTPGDASAAEVVEHGLRPRTARRVRQRQRQRERQRERERQRRRAPETASRARSTPAAAAARRHARRRGPRQQRGSPPAPRACSRPPHHRSTAQPAVHAPAPIGTQRCRWRLSRPGGRPAARQPVPSRRRMRTARLKIVSTGRALCGGFRRLSRGRPFGGQRPLRGFPAHHGPPAAAKKCVNPYARFSATGLCEPGINLLIDLVYAVVRRVREKPLSIVSGGGRRDPWQGHELTRIMRQRWDIWTAR